MEEVSEFKKACQRVAMTDDGKTLLRGIMRLCSWDKSNVVLDEHSDISINSTLYNLGRHNVYLQIRDQLTARQRAQIETGEILCQTTTK